MDDLPRRLANLSVRISRMNQKQNALALPERLESLSKRIRKVGRKIDNVISSHDHYIKKRLPSVLKRQKIKDSMFKSYASLMKQFKKNKFIQLSSHNRLRRVGLFTWVEMRRLRNLLKAYHSFDYHLLNIFQKNSKLPCQKRRHLVLLTDYEIHKLKRWLNEEKPWRSKMKER
jgi:hypothetical protein